MYSRVCACACVCSGVQRLAFSSDHEARHSTWVDAPKIGLAPNKTHVLATNKTEVLALNKADVLAPNKRDVLAPNKADVSAPNKAAVLLAQQETFLAPN